MASSFMSPLESKSGTNLHRVRMFGLDKLSNAAVDHKWDRVKIVCTQPFNKVGDFLVCFVPFSSINFEISLSNLPQIAIVFFSSENHNFLEF